MRIRKLYLAATVVAATAALAACAGPVPPNTDNDPPPEEPEVVALKQLTADGDTVKNSDGETILLRGVNAGGLFVTEHWMTGFVYGSSPSNDFRSLTQTFISRFGEENTKELWREYRDNWWSDADFEICERMGINCIRLPFTYMTLDFAAVRDNDYADAGKAYDFTLLDDFVEKAAARGIYTILDMHGAYGSQNGQDHSGQIIGSASDVGFYSDERMMKLTADMWTAIAEHYADNPAVAGYDILNEPGEKAGLTSERHFECFDMLYDAIRSKDEKHIVIIESCWDGKDLPKPETYGWENCMYSFHHYPGDKLTVNEHGTSWNDKLDGVEEQKFGLPLQMGEFTNYGSTEKWDYTLDLMNRRGWHWTSWTYKIWGNMPWGVVNIRGANDQKVNATNDEYADILAKFALLRTGGEASKLYAFGSGENTRSLESIIKQYATAPLTDIPNSGEYDFTVNEMYVTATDRLGVTTDYNARRTVKITNAAVGGATVTVGGKQMYVGAGGAVMCGTPQTQSSAKFDAVMTASGEIAFVSRSTCKYLRLAGETFVADATTISEACKFAAE